MTILDSEDNKHGIFLIKKGTMKDFDTIEDIQEDGYGKVMWASNDILLGRLVGGEEFLIYYNDKAVGFLHTRLKTGKTVHILNFVILSDYQGLGLGTYALQWVKRYFKEQNKLRLTLKARSTNKEVVQFYKDRGFVEFNRQIGYYSDTGEDAIEKEYLLND